MKREKALEMSPKEQEEEGLIREGQTEKQDGALQSGRGNLGDPSVGSCAWSYRWGREDNQAQHVKDRSGLEASLWWVMECYC